MSDLSIKSFLEENGARNGRIAIRGKIVSKFEAGLFSFADQSGCAQVKAPSKFLKQITIGKFVKIINPEVNLEDGQKRIMVGEKSMIIPTRRIKELDSLGMETNIEDCATLAMMATLDPDQKVPKVRVIVLKDLGINKVGIRNCHRSLSGF